MTDRTAIAACRRVVIKLGTRVLTHDDGRLALARLFDVVEAAAAARGQGKDVLLVSSGALGLGREALGLDPALDDLAGRQACAAVGQSRLMALYEQGFSRVGLVCGQVLLTEGDFDDRLRYLNLRSTLLALLGCGAVPIINENDAVSTEELACEERGGRPVFGDNDRLSALVASKLDADLLVLLTDVDGLHEQDPRFSPGAPLVAAIAPDGSNLPADFGGEPGGEGSRGGMSSKVQAARIAARAGCHAIIANGRRPGGLADLLAGGAAGTWFQADTGLSARKSWIAFATAPRGTLWLDGGAVAALKERGASLLAVGVGRVDGDFARGDVVRLLDPDGALIGRGLVQVDAAEARLWTTGSAPQGTRNRHALVLRDHLVLESS